MEGSSPAIYQGTTETLAPTILEQRTDIRLSTEELRILRECNKESFYYRCLPFALAGMAATYIAVKKGFLAANPRWGPGLKMTAAAAVGWIVGKISYRQKCENKFLNLKDSQVSDAIRKRRGLTTEIFREDLAYSKTQSDDFILQDEKSHLFSDDYHSSSGSLNLDTDKNLQYSGLDDRERPSTDREISPLSEENESKRTSTTYEELRKRNREEYESRSRHPQLPKSDPVYPSGVQKSWSKYDSGPPRQYNPESTEGPSKNVYGDSWDSPKFS